MSVLTKKIEEKALGLSVEERVALAEKLLSSIDSPLQSSFDKKWGDESENRIKAFERGEVGASEAVMVYERMENKYGK